MRPGIPPWCSWLGNLYSLVDARVFPGDYLVLNPFSGEEVVAVVVALLDPFSVIVIPKYKASSTGTGPWRFMCTNLERIIESYTGEEISIASNRVGLSSLTPYYDVLVPIVGVGEFSRILHCSGYLALENISRKPLHKLEECMLELLYFMSVASVRPTGSILIRSYHIASDIDLVIGKYLDAVKFVEEFSERLGSIAQPVVEDYLKEGLRRGLRPEEARKLYRQWSKFRLVLPPSTNTNNSDKESCTGVRISVSLFSDRLRNSFAKIIVETLSRSTVEDRVRIEGFQETLLAYPGIAFSDKLPVVVLDGYFVPALFEGGVFSVKGLKGRLCLASDCFEAIVIGAREYNGKIVLNS